MNVSDTAGIAVTNTAGKENTYYIPVGTVIHRSKTGLTMGDWEVCKTTKAVRYTEAERLKIDNDWAFLTLGKFVFRLPPEATPWVAIAVYVTSVVVSTDSQAVL